MDGKAPLLAASVLFAVGAVGLLLTGAERADWGPFQAHSAPQRVVLFNAGAPFVEPPPLEELRAAPATAIVTAEPRLLVTAPETAEEPSAPDPTPTPMPTVRVFGISSDSGVSAAQVTPTPPRIMIGGIAADDGDATETPDPGATPAPEEPPAD